MTEHAKIRRVIDSYVAGVLGGDINLLAAQFRTDARMWGYLDESLVSAPIQGFFDVVSAIEDPSWGEAYRSVIRDIAVNGEVGTAVLEETAFLGQDFVNHFSLIREDGVWQIASKTFMGVSQ